MLKLKIVFTVPMLLMSSLFPLAASAAIPVPGWGYSFGNYLSGQSDDPNNPFVITEGWGWLLDPPTDNPIISGRITLKFDPSWTIGGYGWLGEFGANPDLSAPAVNATLFSSSLLQPNGNPAMQSSNITIDQTNGIAVFEFDWGTQGFVATKNVSSSGHFNIAAIYFKDPSSPPSNNLVTSYGAGSVAPYGIVGSPSETALLGTNSSTYMLCQSGYCGEPVPEPSSILGIGTALGFVTLLKRKFLAIKR
ncbi:MAG TPA: PEP-CTERM sorting domain-containing protein [Trichormus sp. M33_DOE_039]|nr:PEP-CTERM sorting domain-containing protein [Trichormus sp. M33_DOE_039]